MRPQSLPSAELSAAQREEAARRYGVPQDDPFAKE